VALNMRAEMEVGFNKADQRYARKIQGELCKGQNGAPPATLNVKTDAAGQFVRAYQWRLKGRVVV
jgi:hypothetical protein